MLAIRKDEVDDHHTETVEIMGFTAVGFCLSYPPGAKIMGRNNHEDNYKANNAVTDQLISGITDTQKETDASNDGEEAIMNVVTPKTAASMMAHPCKTKNLIIIPVDYVSLEVEQHTLIKQSRGVARESLNAHMGKSWKRIAHDPHFSTHALSMNLKPWVQRGFSKRQ